MLKWKIRRFGKVTDFGQWSRAVVAIDVCLSFKLAIVFSSSYFRFPNVESNYYHVNRRGEQEIIPLIIRKYWWRTDTVYSVQCTCSISVPNKLKISADLKICIAHSHREKCRYISIFLQISPSHLPYQSPFPYPLYCIFFLYLPP